MKANSMKLSPILPRAIWKGLWLLWMIVGTLDRVGCSLVGEGTANLRQGVHLDKRVNIL